MPIDRSVSSMIAFIGRLAPAMNARIPANTAAREFSGELMTTDRAYTDEDVKAFIARASELADRSRDALTGDDLKRIGSDLGFSDAIVQGALAALERDRALRAARRTRAVRSIAAFVAIDVVTFGGLFAHSSVLEGDAHVARAAIVTAVDRQLEVEKRFTTDTREGQAEIAGALNRITIARRAYDEAALAYNDSIGRTLFMRETLPPSSEIAQ